jgi:vacuolar-type H+-ATPase subunit H
MKSYEQQRSAQTGRSPEEEALYQVLSIEREAQAIIAEAEEEAERLVLAARQRATELGQEAQRDAQNIAQLAASQAQSEALRNADLIRAQAGVELAAWERAAQPLQESAAARVLTLVTLGTGEPDGVRR